LTPELLVLKEKPLLGVLVAEPKGLGLLKENPLLNPDDVVPPGVENVNEGFAPSGMVAVSRTGLMSIVESPLPFGGVVGRAGTAPNGEVLLGGPPKEKLVVVSLGEVPKLGAWGFAIVVDEPAPLVAAPNPNKGFAAEVD